MKKIQQNIEMSYFQLRYPAPVFRCFAREFMLFLLVLLNSIGIAVFTPVNSSGKVEKRHRKQKSVAASGNRSMAAPLHVPAPQY